MNSDPKPDSSPNEEFETEKYDNKPPVNPVFFDAKKLRWPLFVRLTALLLTVAGLGVLTLIASLFALRYMPIVPLPKVSQDYEFGSLEGNLNDRERGKFKQKIFKNADEQLLNKDIQKIQLTDQKRTLERRDRVQKAKEFLQLVSANPVITAPKTPVVAAFYVNWESTSYASARKNIDGMTHFIPEWLHLKTAGSDFLNPSIEHAPFMDGRNKQDRDDMTPYVHAHKIPILPIINNYTKSGGEEGTGNWDSKAVHQIVSNPKARLNLIAQLRDWLVKEQLQGINIDFEQVQAEDKENLVVFMKELYTAFHDKNLLVTEDVELDSEGFDYGALSEWNDWLVPMFYDQHDPTGEPGPVAGVDWTKERLKTLLKTVPTEKLVMGVGNQAYDWTGGKSGAADLTFQSAIIACKESQPDAIIALDPTSLNPFFTYNDTSIGKDGKEHDEKHTVWMQDAVSVYNQLIVAKNSGIRGAALWFVGAEDPSLWTFYHKDKWNDDWSQIVKAGSLDVIKYSGQDEVSFEGVGEILQPLTKTSDGKRNVVLSPKSGFIISETFENDANGVPKLPSAYVIRRYAGGDLNPKKQIVLTFDDGPDATWTPQILDILKRYHVPATFFVVGQNVQQNQALTRRIFAEGNEIGNHSWSHPDLYKLPDEVQRLQLTSTQRIIQAVTGHSTILFRPPYGGDVEPKYGKQVYPMEIAVELGYVTVGEKNDPQDWRDDEYIPGTELMDPTRPRSYSDILNSVVTNRNEGSVVLLHDAGGDRNKTVAALPGIIEGLQNKGYTFVTVAQLWGESRDRVMPKVTGGARALVGADKYVFEVSYYFWLILTTLFTLSIFLGVSRVAIFVVLALIQRHREKLRVFPVGFTPTVSVIIAAYNEEKVICRTIQSLLDGDFKNMEIIVVDDGSKDKTSEVVTEAYGKNPQITLLRKPNGGKATALNRGIEVATGEIMVSLDADTLFAADTITRLVRHFKDPKVGAVSGNVRVGNANNIWTRWQSLEYITSQNFDRRGYDLLNCITVVPGAVGALRRGAVQAVGGYTSDTLAEDTDLTWKLRRSGWRIVNDNSAMAYTEAPETLSSLAKQRYRWAFGTLQCLYKHRAALGHDGAFGWIALPSLWLYQILFPAISPFMDLAMLASIFTGNFRLLGVFFLGMSLIELAAAFLALRMDKGDMRLLPWLILQRFVYRQLMYYVILKSIVSAIRGGNVGWGKLERTGKAKVGA